MPKVVDSVMVKVEDLGVEGEKRRFTIQIEGKESLFALSNILAKEGALRPLSRRLKSKCTAEVLDYISSGKRALKELKSKEAAPDDAALA